ncbi:uncharacterized protein LOC108225215 [Daucus carota subsp. sativus]|uniref:uncharacterized protein LOC108225215 n=1 Tax=Daucus carota subsp. sativus TaxID=79200 RepID=UPI0007EF5228|nr:PREDICTED: uncharacterized protein LOC108225215 [Daucus carota subsp. sativus]
MATSLTKTLARKLTSPRRFLTALRHQSSQSGNNNPIVIIGEQQQQVEFETLTVQRIEDAIHGIIVKRSAPDWLPFRPGYSYWVPPRRDSYGIAELVHTFSNNLTDDEVMSLTTSRGWPSSTVFSTGIGSNLDESLSQSKEGTISSEESQSEDVEESQSEKEE